MKSVLISINPKWCELISNGYKTIEVRKTAPKMETPFKCYIYYCKQSYQWFARQLDVSNHPDLTATYLNRHLGKIIGEFICDEITSFETDGSIQRYRCANQLRMACVPVEEALQYSKGKTLYGWHISDLKIYDKPKELSEFKKYNRKCKYSDLGYAIPKCTECKECNLIRPPQSWCYVEEHK